MAPADERKGIVEVRWLVVRTFDVVWVIRKTSCKSAKTRSVGRSREEGEFKESKTVVSNREWRIFEGLEIFLWKG